MDVKTSDSLKNKTISGIGWSAADAFLGQGITFLVGLILARLLSPEEYGLIGICLIFTNILNGIVDSGFSNALIRKKAVEDNDYNTMFVTNLVISIVLYVLLFLLSPLIARFFNHGELIPLIRAVGWVLVINALSITQITRLTKKMDFRTKTKASFISAIISGIFGVVMAYVGYGVWALVAQVLSKQIFYTICLWIFNRLRPTFSFSIESFKYMWGFGSKLMLSGMLDNIWKQLYQVVVGKFYSAATLGQYSRSKEYANIFSANITLIVQRVSYPALAEIQDDKVRMVAAYRKVIKLTMFVSCICLISLGAVAEPLIYCLIGPKWNEAASYLPLICLSMSLYPLHAINLNMLQIQGRSDILLYIEILKKIIGLIPLSIGVLFNIYWMLIASIFVGIVSFFLNSFYTGMVLKYSSFKQLKDVSVSYVLALIVAIPVYFLKLLPLSYWIILPMQIIIGAAVCIIICEVLHLNEYIEIKNICLSILSKKYVK